MDNFIGNKPGTYDGELSVAHVACCTDSTCTRVDGNGQCYSDKHEDKNDGTTWHQANEICKNAGLRLCKSQVEVDRCCSGGCGYDNGIVWSNLQVADQTASMYYVYYIILYYIMLY